MDIFLSFLCLVSLYAIGSVALHPGRYFRSRLFWFFFLLTLPNLGLYF